MALAYGLGSTPSTAVQLYIPRSLFFTGKGGCVQLIAENENRFDEFGQPSNERTEIIDINKEKIISVHEENKLHMSVNQNSTIHQTIPEITSEMSNNFNEGAKKLVLKADKCKFSGLSTEKLAITHYSKVG